VRIGEVPPAHDFTHELIVAELHEVLGERQERGLIVSLQQAECFFHVALLEQLSDSKPRKIVEKGF
jgi:hypothetical protein